MTQNAYRVLWGKPNGKIPPEGPRFICHLLRMVLLCLYCNMSPVDMGTATPNCNTCVTCSDSYCCVHAATYHPLKLLPLCPLCNMPFVEIGNVVPILQHLVTYWDWYCCPCCTMLLRLVLLHLHCTMWPAETGTVMSTWKHLVTYWNYIIMSILQCFLVTCWDWYCHVHVSTSDMLVKYTAQPTICLQQCYTASIINPLAPELNTSCDVKQIVI